MPSYTSYMRQMAVLDADDNEIESWITVRGNHIPIRKGQSKEDAVKSFIEKKGGDVEKESKPESKKDYTIAHKDKSGNTTIIAEVSHKDVNSGESDYDKEYHKVRSELKEAFSDYPKFNIKDNFAVSENDYKRVVAEKYKDGVIGVTTETAEGLLLNHADFKDWDSAAKYAEKERAQHKINVGGSENAKKKEPEYESFYNNGFPTTGFGDSLKKDISVVKSEKWNKESEGISFGKSTYGDTGTYTTLKISDRLYNWMKGDEDKIKNVAKHYKMPSKYDYAWEDINNLGRALKNARKVDGGYEIDVETTTYSWFHD